ncbi:MAG: hypothetical protein OXC06_04885 [Acidimicrobiaceae bacterium]|nr:hypothetical protein [Acidimicrobiaceae bacterium]
MATVTVSRSGDRLIAVKQVPAAHAPNLEREAETLRRLDHPGAVRFVDLIETPDGGRALQTEFVSSDTWATRPATDPAERAAGVAALAEVVADLHDTGLAHCQINPSHVLHGDDDRPVLCGFRQATEATVENRRDDLVALADLCHDPALEPGPLVGKLSALADEARAGRLDVRELARRLAMVSDKRPAAVEPARAARAGRDRMDGPRTKRSRRRSLVVAAAVLGVSAAVLATGVWNRGRQATSAPMTVLHRAAPPVVPAGTEAGAGDGQTGETAAPGDGQTGEVADDAGSLIAAAADSVPAISENTATGADAAATRGSSPPNPAVAAGGHPTDPAANRASSPADPAAAAGEHPTATAAARTSSLPNAATTAGEHPTATAAARTSSLPNAATAAGEHPTATAAPPSPMIPGMLGPGAAAGPGLAGAAASSAMSSTAGGSLLPPTPIGMDRAPPDGLAGGEPGTVLEHGGRLYGVGAPGDFVETGDWDCDGEPTPAIVRPSTGDVVLFDAWPAPHQSISMPVRWEVENPTGAEAVAQGSCDLLRVYTPAGSRLFDPMADR